MMYYASFETVEMQFHQNPTYCIHALGHDGVFS